jgi:hypothetical protein
LLVIVLMSAIKIYKYLRAKNWFPSLTTLPIMTGEHIQVGLQIFKYVNQMQPSIFKKASTDLQKKFSKIISVFSSPFSYKHSLILLFLRP